MADHHALANPPGHLQPSRLIDPKLLAAQTSASLGLPAVATAGGLWAGSAYLTVAAGSKLIVSADGNAINWSVPNRAFKPYRSRSVAVSTASTARVRYRVHRVMAPVSPRCGSTLPTVGTATGCTLVARLRGKPMRCRHLNGPTAG